MSIRDFTSGVGYIFRGFSFLSSHARLWVWAILPTIINLAILAAMIGVFIHFYSGINEWLSARLSLHGFENPDAWWQDVVGAALWVANKILQIFIALLSIIMLLIVSYGLSFVVAGPFNDILSERVEIIVTGKEPPPLSFRSFIVGAWRTIKTEAVKAAILISIPISLFVLSFIPLFGGPFYVAATFVFGAWDLGFSFADIPMARRIMPWRERWEFAKRNFFILTGLGAGLAIPFFALIFQAPMVVAGTLLYIERKVLITNDQFPITK